MSTTWRREYLCEHICDANLQIVPEWSEEFVQEVDRDIFYKFYHRYEAMDLGVKDHTAVLFAYYDFKRACLIIEDEYIVNGPELTTLSLQEAIKSKEKELWDGYPIYLRISDSNNPLLLQDLSHLHKIHFIPTDKGRLEEMVNLVKMQVRSGGIIVHPRCKSLRGCLKYGVWDSKRDKFSRSPTYGHFDALAALIYLVRNLNKSTNPIPQDFQVDRDNQILFHYRRESEDAKTLRTAFKFQK